MNRTKKQSNKHKRITLKSYILNDFCGTFLVELQKIHKSKNIILLI